MSVRWLGIYLLLIAQTALSTSDYSPAAIRLIASEDPICILVSVRDHCYIPTAEEAAQYNDVENKLLYTVTKLTYLYDIPIKYNKQTKDCSNYNVIITYNFRYDSCSFSTVSLEMPYVSELNLLISPKAFAPPSSSLTQLDYVLIWQSATTIDLISSTDTNYIYLIADKDLRSRMEMFALFYKRAKDKKK